MITEQPWMRYGPIKRSVVLVSTGPTVVGAALPHVNPNDRRLNQEGVAKRFGYRPPEPNRRMRRRFARFVKRWLKKYMVPLSPDVNTTFEEWLKNTNYPDWRKEELRQVWSQYNEENALSTVEDRIGSRAENPKLVTCNSFPKDETYGEYKYTRLINARHDYFKCLTGPVFKCIEKELFAMKWFIKKIPVADRPKYIKEVMAGCTYAIATDYTSFEALFTESMMLDCEMQLYEYMIRDIPARKIFSYALEFLLRQNTCRFKDFKVYLDATRMSGEMCTSLGNSFSNLMFMLFIMEENGVHEEQVRGVVEGDDGLFCAPGPPPRAEQFEQLGLKIKLEVHPEITTASFCGLVFDPEDCVNVTDPLKMLISMGWTSAKYASVRESKMKSLLRSKALSVAYQYPGCPILGHAARSYLRLTAGYDLKWVEDRMDWWQRERLSWQTGDVPWIEPPFKTRLLVERLYGITVQDQLAIERYLDELTELGPLYLPYSGQMPRDWQDYWNTYVTQINVRSREVVEEVALHEMLPGYRPQVVPGIAPSKVYRRRATPMRFQPYDPPPA